MHLESKPPLLYKEQLEQNPTVINPKADGMKASFSLASSIMFISIIKGSINVSVLNEV